MPNVDLGAYSVTGELATYRWVQLSSSSISASELAITRSAVQLRGRWHGSQLTPGRWMPSPSEKGPSMDTYRSVAASFFWRPASSAAGLR
jgi:hypothetical protein